jgi:hypothetical protein
MMLIGFQEKWTSDPEGSALFVAKGYDLILNFKLNIVSGK